MDSQLKSTVQVLDGRVAWRYRLDVPPVAMHAAPDDTFLLVSDVYGTVRSLDTGSGELQWEQSYGMNNVHGVRAAQGGGATVLLEEGRLLRLDRAGEQVWESAVGALRSAFDATADGKRIALSAARHEKVGDEIKIGAKISLYDGEGQWSADVELDHPVSQLRFTDDDGGALVCISPDGRVSFLEGERISSEADLGSALESLVTCLDGSLILMSAGTDGIHVLSATEGSLGVLEISGTVEDVDVSEDGSAILVKERDGLITLLDGAFEPRWQSRLERPVLRVDLAEDGTFAYLADESGEITRLDFVTSSETPSSSRATIPAMDGLLKEIAPVGQLSLGGHPMRDGLGRLCFLGAGELAVLPRPEQLLLCSASGDAHRDEALPFSAAHATADPAHGRLALWNYHRFTVVDADGTRKSFEGASAAAVGICADGDLAVGTPGGELRRYGPAGEERWASRVGAGVVGVAQFPDASGELAVLCADGCVVVLDAEGAVQATVELSAPALANPDVARDSLEEAVASTADAESGGSEDFWSHFGRSYQLLADGNGPVLYHGGGRVLRLDAAGVLTADATLGLEIAALHPAGEGLFAVSADHHGLILGADLSEQKRFRVASRLACPAGPAGSPVILDLSCDPDALLVRGLDGRLTARAPLPETPRALAVSPDRLRAAVLAGENLYIFDLDA